MDFNSIERNTLLILSVWTIIFAYSLWMSINQEKEIVHQIAISEINSNFNDIDTFRKWIASHGGVYVPLTENITPNPTIKYLPERDITTTTGKQFTLVNTPYLLKQLSISSPQTFNAHMTSLDPLNPANEADAWERKALLSFDEQKTEVCEIVPYKGQPHMRLMRPAKYETRCATCHIEKQYKEGDILGALTVSVPMQHYFDKSDMAINRLSITHSSIWFLGLIGISLVFKQQKKHDIKRRKNEDYLLHTNAAFNNLQEGVMITDSSMNVIAINNTFAELSGFKPNELVGKNPVYLKTDLFGKHQCTTIINTLEMNPHWNEEIELVNKDNDIIPVRLSVTSVYNETKVLTNHIFLYSDISERKEFEKKLEYLAHHDYLTKLPNRLLLNDRLNRAIIHSEREKKKTAILFLDLDHFKNINDTLGHDVGDSVLVEITKRLKGSIRKGDTLARLGGDEFIIIMENIDSENDIIVLAQKIIEHINPSIYIQKQNHYLGASIGISVYPDHGLSSADLISKADIAMYKAKSEGRNKYKFYTSNINTDFHEKINIERDLRQAIKSNEFVFHYQPQISLTDNKIIGAECLIRWHHPKLGIIYPEIFIEIAEEMGMMIPIGELVLNAACSQMREWLNEGIDISTMAINISGKQITSEKLFGQVTKTLSKHDLPASKIELEVIENYMMKQAEKSADTLEKLCNASIKIAIDDFGTGHSSLNYLKKLPIHKIKIDRSFIDGIPFDQHDISIINAVIAIGKDLGLRITAEGVENETQLRFLKNAGCDEYQGYFYSKPLPADEFRSLFIAKHDKDD